MSRLVAFGEREPDHQWSGPGLDGCIGELEALKNIEEEHMKSDRGPVARRIRLVEDAIQLLYDASEI